METIHNISTQVEASIKRKPPILSEFIAPYFTFIVYLPGGDSIFSELGNQELPVRVSIKGGADNPSLT